MKTYCLYVFVILILTLSAGSVSAVWEARDFDYYQIILDRKPFGEPPPAPPPKQTVAKSARESFARNLRLTGLWEIDGVGVYAGIIDTKSKQSYTLAVGDSVDDLGELVSADYQKEEIVLRMGSENATLTLQKSNGKSSPSNSSTHQSQSQSRMSQHQSYIERRKARRAPIKRPPPKKPKYTGEELKARLQAVQMDAIRTGKPPLPIPLTPEMDQKLVDEGVLPPLN